MTGSSEAGWKIRELTIWPVDLALTDDFVISRGAISCARNLFVRIITDSGAVGYGEAAPFPSLTGETRESARKAMERLAKGLKGRPVSGFRELGEWMAAEEPEQPAARCGLEIAILDAYARGLGVPLWSLWGGGPTGKLTTDMTIPMLGAKRSLELAEAWYARGFRCLKMKVGGNLESEIHLVRRLAARWPKVAFILDANQGFSPEDALEFMRRLTRAGVHVALFEQPVDRGDLQGMAWLRSQMDVPLAADEAVFTTTDAQAVIAAGAADVINLKIMKTGVMECLKIAALARAANLSLMIGGMVESRLAMACSLAMVIGLGGFSFLDLDTPLLLKQDPWRGGFAYEGPVLKPWNTPGLGMEPANSGAPFLPPD